MLFLGLFMPIVLISLCGNTLVCRTLLKNRRLRSNSTNMLIGVLAISDLMMTTFNIPFTIVDCVLKDWIFGDFWCILVSFVSANSVYVSSFTIAVIAASRHRAIFKFKSHSKSSTSQASEHCSPSNTANRPQTLLSSEITSKCSCCCFKSLLCQRSEQASHDPQICMELHNSELSIRPKSTNSRHRIKPNIKLSANTKLKLLIFSIWFLAALHSLPHTIFSRVKTIPVKILRFSNDSHIENAFLEEVTVRRCLPIFPEELGSSFRLYLTLFTCITQYFIPLSCAGIIYLQIGLAIRTQGKVGQISRLKAEQLSKKKRRRLLMLALIVLVFALSWMPFNIYYLLLDFGVIKTTNHVIFLICLWLALTRYVCYLLLIILSAFIIKLNQMPFKYKK